MIVVEGPDGSGKTTLAKRLSEELDISLEPRAVSKDAEALVDLKLWTEIDVSKGFGRRLYDRHRLISEPIYGPVLRVKPEPGFESPSWLANQLARFYWAEPVVIYCLPPFEAVWRNVKEDPDNEIVQDFRIIFQIYQLYKMRCAFDLAGLSRVLPIVWDYVNDEDTGYFASIAHQCKRRLMAKGYSHAG